MVSDIHLSVLILSAPASLSVHVCKVSVHYPYKISCLVIGIKEIVTNSNLSKMKNKIPIRNCAIGNLCIVGW